MGVIIEISDDEMVVILKRTSFSSWSDVDIHEFLNILESDLRKNGIIVGVDKSALISVYTQNKKEAVIARGIPYKSGRDGYLEFIIKTDKPRILYTETFSEEDIFKMASIPFARKGDVIGKLHKPIKGENGISVRGRIIHAPPVRDVEVKILSNSIVFKEDEDKIVAIADIRPVVHKKDEKDKFVYFFNSIPMLMYAGSIPKNSRPVTFDGDVIINGNVEKGNQIIVSGNVQILGSVYESVIHGGQNIIIYGGIVDSQLHAGFLPENIFDKIELHAVNLTVEKLSAIFVHIKELPTVMNNSRDLSEKIKLIETLKEELKTSSREISMTRSSKVFQDLLEYLKSLAKTLNNILDYDIIGLIKHLNSLKEIFEKILFISRVLDEEHENKGHILAKWVHDSKIYAMKDVIITSEAGCYNTKISTNGSVSINGKVKMSTIEFKKNIFIKEAGSYGVGSHVLLKGSKNSIVKILYGYEGVELYFDKIGYKLKNGEKIKLYLDKDEKVVEDIV
ncbi:MAG TPA: DUF342 domain-containing protein [Clostridia bacterium]|nr:DUF342 domain-containing protein [Clostridia bacterium]